MSLAPRLDKIRKRIRGALERTKRSPGAITLIAVTKGHPVDAVRSALEENCTDVGENYVQEMLQKQDEIPSDSLRWHLIGPLQRNKVKFVIGRVSLLHTVDNVRLAMEIEKRAAAADAPMNVLCQVNVAGEAQKSGVAPSDLPELLSEIATFSHVRVRGLMTVPPLSDTPEDSRRYFRELRRLRDEVQRQFPALPLAHLSMGMSDDFEVAIEEGATLIRIGTALLGPRPAKDKEAAG